MIGSWHNNRAAGLLALRDVAEAYGGLGAVAAQAGISREALCRSLSPKGNPTLKTLLAVFKSVGMRLSVEPGHHAPAEEHASRRIGKGQETGKCPSQPLGGRLMVKLGSVPGYHLPSKNSPTI